ncbi:FKBP-type peptidyl-prolyl cis-trans isomerase [Actinospica sp. MGRD01-02]|uniref:peptidylprolyl isomerase n=1 Tax=Actinospica acidithermotolerans TaxID=2828514 RepID=A0A941EL46_9ACTN|nr:FKBP-type peptidyl-prolyl cis-trans isomerase [Actinospica acidithermotolerans]MBR7831084.1 FKBP-type peptidyl-prolyl cis-trans isomerase [Actinospica acidithermotolerans]
MRSGVIRAARPRRSAAAIAAVLAALLMTCGLPSLAACSGSSGDSSLPRVSGALGADPQIALPDGDPPSGLVVRTLIQGAGPQVKADDLALVYVEGKVWAGDREVFDSYTDRQPQSVPLATGGVLPAWKQLAGRRVGSRVMMVVPPSDGFGSKGDSQLNIASSDTLVFVFDVLSAVSEGAAANGSAIAYDPGKSLPTVKETSAGPKITIPAKTSPPKKLVVKTLVKGNGAPLASGQTVVVQYSGVVWRSGRLFDSSYTTKTPDSFVLGAGQVIPGWEQGLGGVTVGSRVLLVVPPSLAYGDQAEPPYIDNNDTLVFVIDVIDAYTPEGS